MEHHNPEHVAGPHTERYMRYAIVGEREDCWEWTGPHDRHGYAKSHAGTTTGAHRVAYLIHRGPIQEGLVLDHLCMNRWCVNPWHLQAVTNAENILRQRRTGMCRSGLHVMNDANTVWLNGGKHRRCRTCNNARLREAGARYRAKKKALAQSSRP